MATSAPAPSSSSSPNAWSLGGTPPEPAYAPSYTPEEAAAIRAEVDKDRAAEVAKRESAVARGLRKAKALSAAKAKAEADAAAKIADAEQRAGIDPADGIPPA